MQERSVLRLDDAASTSSNPPSARVSVVCPIEQVRLQLFSYHISTAALNLTSPLFQHLIMDHSYASSLTKSRGIEEEFLDLAHEVRSYQLFTSNIS